ncbi:MAG: TonB family protein, partial [Myxococcota bacterium]|nr:TonB family protein [Myxococcota bacterium]
TRPTEELVGLEDAVPLPAVTFQPKLRGAPPQIVVPQEAIDAGIEGSWTVKLDINAEGRVVRALMKSKAGYGIDQACVQAWKATRWRPARKNGQAVAVLNVPKKCTLKAIE